MFHYNTSYIMYVLPAVLFAFYAQYKVKDTFNKYKVVRSRDGYTGAEIAKKILHQAGIFDVSVEDTPGELQDHYDPRNKVLRLSQSVYNSSSVSAIGVAAHEVGHAIQHNKNYIFLIVRNGLIPIVNIGSSMSMPLIMLGLFLEFFIRSNLGYYVIQFGIVLFAGVVLFQLITLPVEFDASSRALRILGSYNYLTEEETKQAKKVLNAAALTYVAATAVSLAQLLRYLAIFGGRRRD